MSAGRGENNMRSRIAREGARAGRLPSLPQQWPVSSQAVRTFDVSWKSPCQRRRSRDRSFLDERRLLVSNRVSSCQLSLLWVASLLGRLSNRHVFVHVFVGRAKGALGTRVWKGLRILKRSTFLSMNIILFRGYVQGIHRVLRRRNIRRYRWIT